MWIGECDFVCIELELIRHHVVMIWNTHDDTIGVCTTSAIAEGTHQKVEFVRSGLFWDAMWKYSVCIPSQHCYMIPKLCHDYKTYSDKTFTVYTQSVGS